MDGSNGVLSKAFAFVLGSLWGRNNRVVKQTEFKTVMGRKYPHFEYDEQQDSQDFLCSLVDYLHEDVNQVSGQKPNFDQEEDAGLPDIVLIF